MKNIIFIAPPAAGKGTQSSLLEKNMGYLHLSTGDLLRAEIKKGTELGSEIEEIMSKGELVSDELITRLLKNELESLKEKQFILDGYPRNINQAETLDTLFKELEIDNYLAIYLNIAEEEAMKRVLGRIVCSTCGTSYNKYFQDLQPKENGKCDKCGSALVERTDDNEETFKTRFSTYLESTTPLLDYYKEKGRLRVVETKENPEETYKGIEEILKSEDVDN